MKVEITSVAIPRSTADDNAGSFIELVDVANTVTWHTWNNDDFVYPPEDEIATYRSSAFHERLSFLARLDGLPVGYLTVMLPLDEDATTAEITLGIVPGARRRGIGTALLTQAEKIAALGGRLDLRGFSEEARARTPHDGANRSSDSGDRSDGFASDLPAQAFAHASGYTLGQIELVSQLDVPLETALDKRLTRDAADVAGAEYDLVHWWRHAPDHLIDGYALLRATMTQDVPHDGIVLEHESWDATRVRDYENRQIERGEPLLTTAAVHQPSGVVAAYTEVAVASGSDKVEQYDTLVATAHRGHRLGLLMKLENLRRLAEVAPQVTRVLTWNADENDHMRAINDALGFRVIARECNWQKHADD